MGTPKSAKSVLKTVLLVALPASGKSEVRRYLASLSPDECRNSFHMGETAQLDDYPYVHMMRRVDDELAVLGQKRVFFHAADRPFQNPVDWGTLIHLLNEDYEDMIAKKAFNVESAADLLLTRYDEAAKKAKGPVRFDASAMTPDVRKQLVARLEDEAKIMLHDKMEDDPDTLEGKTLVMECARGGPHKAMFPLPEHMGYNYSLGQLSDALLENASILYIWVTPEESRRKNTERADPNDPGSILNHGVPMEVMRNDYGCDDLQWLEDGAEKPGTVTVKAHGRTYHVPVARFDNRVDKTTFIRKDKKEWRKDEVEAVHNELKRALDHLARFNGIMAGAGFASHSEKHSKMESTL